jgi:hypothetical protein
MESITISLQLANAIRQYLGTRPFDEAAPLIMALQEAANKSATPAVPGEIEKKG